MEFTTRIFRKKGTAAIVYVVLDIASLNSMLYNDQREIDFVKI